MNVDFPGLLLTCWIDFAFIGSPFHPKVVNTKKVRVIGGWDSLLDSQNRMALITGEEKKLSFDCNEAGPGILSRVSLGSESLLSRSPLNL